MEISEDTAKIPDKKGSYCLIFHLKESTEVTVGKFGTYTFQNGYYYYFGSAKGSGGLRARINRHISMEKNKFWHIDYLRSSMDFIATVFTTDFNKECEWCQEIEEKYSLSVPVKRFGSGDCLSGCKAHLLHSNLLVNLNEFCDSLDNSNLVYGSHFLFIEENNESTVKSKRKFSN